MSKILCFLNDFTPKSLEKGQVKLKNAVLKGIKDFG